MKNRHTGTVFILAVLFLISGAPRFLDAQETSGEKKTFAQQKNDDGYEPPEAVFDERKVRLSGYGGPTVRFSSLNNKLAVFSGGKGGMIINDSLVLGFSGYGMVTPRYLVPGGLEKSIGYGGFLLEYIFFPKSMFNFSVGAIIGAGSYNGSPSFFLLEPELIFYVNITRFFKLGLSASYRYTSGLDSPLAVDATFSTFSGGLVFAFGKF